MTPKPRRKFLINPASGKGISPSEIRALKDYVLAQGEPFDFWVSPSQAELKAYTRKLLSQGLVDQVVSVGGDGTLHTIVNGFFDHGAPIRPSVRLAVADLGTGADFFRGLAARSKERDWKKHLDAAPQAFDLGRATFKDPRFLPTYFINAASLGLSAAVVQKKELLPKRVLPLSLSYLAPTILSLLSYEAKPVEITLGGTAEGHNFNPPIKAKLLLLSIFKGLYFGGGMKLGAGSLPDDGLFKVTVVKKMSPLEALRKLPEVYRGEIGKSKLIQIFSSKSLEVKSAHPLPVELDGELYGQTDVRFEVVPKAILIDVLR